MNAGYEVAKVEFESKTVIVDLVSVGGLCGDWNARSKDDADWIGHLIGFERALSRAIDSDEGVAEYKSITVTIA